MRRPKVFKNVGLKVKGAEFKGQRCMVQRPNPLFVAILSADLSIHIDIKAEPHHPLDTGGKVARVFEREP